MKNVTFQQVQLASPLPFNSRSSAIPLAVTITQKTHKQDKRKAFPETILLHA